MRNYHLLDLNHQDSISQVAHSYQMLIDVWLQRWRGKHRRRPHETSIWSPWLKGTGKLQGFLWCHRFNGAPRTSQSRSSLSDRYVTHGGQGTPSGSTSCLLPKYVFHEPFKTFYFSFCFQIWVLKTFCQ